MALLANVHCNVSLVWFEPSVVCYTINTRSPSRLLLGYLLLPRVMAILWLWFYKMGTFTCSSNSQMGKIWVDVDLGGS